jgi:hypothetical protein
MKSCAKIVFLVLLFFTILPVLPKKTKIKIWQNKNSVYLCTPFNNEAIRIPKERNGAVAQSVEQRTENPCVAGSIPAHTTKSLREI